MFARNVSLRLKPNTLSEFTQTLEKDVLPILRKQPGFRDEITLAFEGDTEVIAISLWDSKEQAETYNTTAYPEVLMRLEKVLDGPPKVRVSTVINSTFHKIVAMAA
jgi:heme-degrading monooxygenase HmoA